MTKVEFELERWGPCPDQLQEPRHRRRATHRARHRHRPDRCRSHRTDPQPDRRHQRTQDRTRATDLNGSPQPARRAYHRSPRSRQTRRRGRRRRPLSLASRLRPSQRDGAVTGLVRQPRTTPAQQKRQPATQRRSPPHRPHPSPITPGRDRVPAAPDSFRRNQQRIHASAQATSLRRRLQSHARRRLTPTRHPQPNGGLT